MSVFTDEQFVIRWLEARRLGMNQSWVADELDVTRQAVETRKQALTKAGVNLPALPRINRGIHRNVTHLNQIIAEATGEGSQ